jgi:hypothetical protein
MTDPYVLGPCRCQACGNGVVLVFHRKRDRYRWLHPDGTFTCDTPKRIYWRVMKRQSRARLAARAVSSVQ